MKKSKLMHLSSIILGIWGGLALVMAWLAGESGTVFGFSQQHLYSDAIALEVIAISAGVCALYRRQLEREGDSSYL